MPRRTAASIGFPPIARAHTRVLVLGTLPGRESLRRGEYYAHSANAFWRITGALCDAGPELAYTERVRRLARSGIGVWDVLASAHRHGSADAAIDRASARCNEFTAFFAKHRRIELIAFNGATAAALFERRVVQGLPPHAQQIRRVVLPSTSPANAATPYARKLVRWRRALTLS
jgi:hypoxanthine-DNA glycosylase